MPAATITDAFLRSPCASRPAYPDRTSARIGRLRSATAARQPVTRFAVVRCPFAPPGDRHLHVMWRPRRRPRQRFATTTR